MMKPTLDLLTQLTENVAFGETVTLTRHLDRLEIKRSTVSRGKKIESSRFIHRRFLTDMQPDALRDLIAGCLWDTAVDVRAEG